MQTAMGRQKGIDTLAGLRSRPGFDLPSGPGLAGKLAPTQTAALIGANMSPGKLSPFSNATPLGKGDALSYFGSPGTGPRFDLTKSQLNVLNKGQLPPGINRPFGDFGLVRAPWETRHNSLNISINNIGINFTSGHFLPPPPRPGLVAPAIHWTYWDGRAYYDHSYAVNVFLNVGHIRHRGYDGVIVGGRYYCYGYGWMDGCIDYGDCRMWVPGFWANYVEEECYGVPVWMPPVYEEVWTGCCWETVLVDGGYFVDPPPHCRLVTRYTWVPGHFEYYLC